MSKGKYFETALKIDADILSVETYVEEMITLEKTRRPGALVLKSVDKN